MAYEHRQRLKKKQRYGYGLGNGNSNSSSYSGEDWLKFRIAAGVPKREAVDYACLFIYNNTQVEDMLDMCDTDYWLVCVDNDDEHAIESHIYNVQDLYGENASLDKYLMPTKLVPKPTEEERKKKEEKMLKEQVELVKKHGSNMTYETWFSFLTAAGIPERQAHLYAGVFDDRVESVKTLPEYVDDEDFYCVVENDDQDLMFEHGYRIRKLIAEEEGREVSGSEEDSDVEDFQKSSPNKEIKPTIPKIETSEVHEKKVKIEPQENLPSSSGTQKIKTEKAESLITKSEKREVSCSEIEDVIGVPAKKVKPN
ncbi:hypothetical protein DMENIID0001_060610 [Sergentomyia squamirostris]